MSDSTDSEIASKSMCIGLEYSFKIEDITRYYRRATEQLIDDTGNANDAAPEALAGSLRLDDVRDLVFHLCDKKNCDECREAMLSEPWGRVEWARKKLREVTDRFEAKLEEVKALDTRWNDVDPDEIKGSATYDELILKMTRLWVGRSTIPRIPSVTVPELPTRSSVASGATPWEMFEYAKLKSPKSTIRLVRMELVSSHPEPPIRITTRTVSLQDKVPYVTLSYTWGNPFGIFCSEKDRDAVPRTDVPIICNGKSFEIGENLYRFLWRWREALATHDDTIRESRLRPPEEIWIDAICINQRDLEGRNQQVSIMGDIYRKSAATWVWLGEHDEFSLMALITLQKIHALSAEGNDADFGSLDQLERDELLANLGLPDSNSWSWFAVFAFFQRQWFRRSWIVQEATLSSCLLFRCGGAVMSGGLIFSLFERFRRFPIIIEMVQYLGKEELRRKLADRPSRKRAGLESSNNEPSDSMYHLCRDGMAPDLAGYLGQVIRLKAIEPNILANDRNGVSLIESENEDKEDKVPELLNLWQTSRYSLCGDMRDKVYAFAALVNRDIFRTPNTVQDRRALQPDYKKPVCEVYCEAAWFTLLTHASLDVRVSIVGIIKDTEQEEPEEFLDDARFRRFLEFSTLLPSTYLSHPDGQTRLEVIWRTIIADAIDGISPASPKYAAAFEKLCKKANEDALDGITEGNVNDEAWEADEDREFWGEAFVMMGTRRLFIADTGHVGCGEFGLFIGDLIVVVAGSSIPLILRHSSSGRYKLIGEAYVHGIMFGEHAMKPGVEWESITLE